MSLFAIRFLIVAWALSLFFVGSWQRHDGAIAERMAWQTRESDQLAAANARLRALEGLAREAEQDKAAALAAISTNYERKLSDANKQRAADAAAVRAGSLRLRDPIPAGLTCGGLPAEVAAGTGQRDGGAAGELSGEATQFLFDLTADADDVARQLAACQQVVIEDRTPALKP